MTPRLDLNDPTSTPHSMARSASTSSASPTPAPHTRPFTSRNASKPASPGTRPPRPDSTTAAGAHEVAHAAQLPFRFDGERGASPHPDSPEYDVQADCSAGATLNEAEQDGYLILEGVIWTGSSRSQTG